MACDPNTLLVNARTFQTLSERDQMICIAALLCDIASGGGVGGGGAQFGDPTDPTNLISGGMIYDALGNLWVDTDPAGSHNWEKIIAVNSAPEPVMAEAQAVVARIEPEPVMVVAALEPPKAEELPPVVLPKSRSRWREALSALKTFMLLLLP